MIRSITVEGFQSLKGASLPRLGPFTVVTGPTGSGKSALIRALRLLAFNARGTAFVSRGESRCEVSVVDDFIEVDGMGDEDMAFTITRGARGADSYELLIPDGVPRIFTKLGGQVPPEVAAAHGWAPINFAGQFDRPFLLAESAGEVARTLGSLTNVSLIFAAAREASRRKAALTAQVRAAEGEVRVLRERAASFAGIRERLDAARTAAEALKEHDRLSGEAAVLRPLAGRLRAAGAEVPVPPAPPSLTELERLVFARTELLTLIRAAAVADQEFRYARVDVAGYADVASRAERDARDLLERAGTCPLCGQLVHTDPRE